MNTPPGTFHPRTLIAALESVRDHGLGIGGDEFAVYKLAEPYRLDGPTPRKDVLKCISTAMALVLDPAELGTHPAINAEANRLYMASLVKSFSS